MSAASPRALAGVRVLDLTRVLAGPWCTQVLADLGAEVIKVERPGSGDDTRGWGPPFLRDASGIDTDESAYYLCANRGKRSLTVDLSTADGQAVIRRLATQCDVLVENFKVGDMARHGLDAATLRALNPRLVYCSITGFGQDGPYAQRAGYDFAVQGLGGLMSLTGEAGGEPQKVGVAVADLFTGMYATVAILAALRHRDATGEGQVIDMALLDAQVAMLANLGSHTLVGGRAMRTPTSCRTRCSPWPMGTSSSPWATIASSPACANCSTSHRSRRTRASRPTPRACAIARRWCRCCRMRFARAGVARGWHRWKQPAFPAGR